MTIEELMSRRPASLTIERAMSFRTRYDIDPEWQKKHDEGTLPDGPVGVIGMMIAIPSEARMTLEEAEWVHALMSPPDLGTWRWLASVVTCGHDDSQPLGHDLAIMAEDVLKEHGKLEGD